MMILNNILIFIIIAVTFYFFTNSRVQKSMERMLPAKFSDMQTRAILSIFFAILIYALVTLIGFRENFSPSYSMNIAKGPSMDQVFIPDVEEKAPMAEATAPTVTYLAELEAGKYPVDIGFMTGQSAPPTDYLRSLENDPFTCGPNMITCKQISSTLNPSDVQVFKSCVAK